MKKLISILSIILIVITSCKKEQDKTDNLKTFAKAFGYVKYFHPSDEASKIDWNYFAAHGAGEIIKCNSKSEVISTLNSLFKPIAPSVVFTETKGNYDFAAITPENTEDYQSTYWQHRGVSLDMSNQNSPYRSVRVNRYSEVDESSRYSNLSRSLNLEKYLGKRIKYTGWVRIKEASKGSGYLWLRVDKSDKTTGFFDNMGSRPIKSNEWQEYEIIGEVDDLASSMTFGSMFMGKGTLYLDAIHLYYEEGDKWIEIPLNNSDFEADEIGNKNENSDWVGRGKGYSFSVSKTENKKGESCAVLSYEGKIKKVIGESIFEEAPEFGELIEKEIGDGIICQIPLNLFGNNENTYPVSDNLKATQDALNILSDSPTELATRLGNIIIAYNVFQHFYPYFEEVNTNWEQELETALNQSFIDKNENDHLITLEKFTASLKDGHIWVSGGSFGKFVPPIHWEWIEDKLIITQVSNDSINLNVGDVVTKIDNMASKEYFKEVNSRISAGTKGWLNHSAQSSSLFGGKDSELLIQVNNETIALKRDKTYNYSVTEIEIQKNKYKLLENGIYYLNLDTIEMDTITSLLPELKAAKGIICDMRGYPNGNHDFISHLLKENDTSKAWLRTPKIIYPDQENMLGYVDTGWEITAKEPFLGDKKVVFIIDGRSISYAESYMSFIEHYNLATIIGQPTAGANGNVNPFALLANYRMSWTGMKVVKHDGSQHHAVGILPDIYVNKTVEGVKSGKDEFLEKAIEVILE
ncbi:S41 family peptidase [Lacinutrix jangbogonensis]|uniref:S41 family peptidase n=1 Tax=Lacinutrix jangbogonensis TaxID=1469557 RepID=UPI00053D21AD|nr:S41 family peptidase [Lacinutrix jangbogonensis]